MLLNTSGGPVLKAITSIIFTVYLIFTSSILIANFSEFLHVVYFHSSPSWIITLIFVITAIIANKLGFRSLIKVNTLIVPIVLITELVVFLGGLGKIEFQRALPILGYGFGQTFISGFSNIFAFGGLIYLYLIRPNLKNNVNYKKVGIISISLSGLFLLLSVASLLFLFPFLINGVNTLSVYMSTRVIEFGTFFERTDALFIFVWLFAFISYLCVIIAYISKINKKNCNVKNPSIFIYLTGLLILAVSLIPSNTSVIRFAETVLYKNAALCIVFGYSFIILIIGYLKKKKVSLIIRRKHILRRSCES